MNLIGQKRSSSSLRPFVGLVLAGVDIGAEVTIQRFTTINTIRPTINRGSVCTVDRLPGIHAMLSTI